MDSLHGDIEMPAPVHVLIARIENNQNALRAMSKKAQRTKAAKKARKKDEREKRLAEEELAEEWYRERRQQELQKEHLREPWVVRRDDLLSSDEL